MTTLKGFIDRIEGHMVVCMIKDIGEIVIEKKKFDFRVYDGRHIKLIVCQDNEAEIKTEKEIKKIQENLCQS
jgi:hypothetical protein